MEEILAVDRRIILGGFGNWQISDGLVDNLTHDAGTAFTGFSRLKSLCGGGGDNLRFGAGQAWET